MKLILIFFTIIFVTNKICLAKPKAKPQSQTEALYYCTTMPDEAFFLHTLKTQSDSLSQSSSESEAIEGEVIRLADCKAAMLIKPMDLDTEKLLSKCIKSGVLKVNIVPFIVVGDYELPDDQFPALFANERPQDAKEPYDFLVHWFTGIDQDLDYDYEDRGLDKEVKATEKASPLQIAVNIMRRGFKQAQKLANQIVKPVTKPGGASAAALGFVAGSILG